MRSINFKQILILIIIFFFLFGDLLNVKKKLNNILKHINNFALKKNRKKGT